MTISSLKTPDSSYAAPGMDDPSDVEVPSRIHEASSFFREAEPERRPPSAQRSVRPVDWPAPGPIDLKIHDLPHASSTTEWWYMNSHIKAETGQRFALFV